jgi:ABC-type multidrug transport system fused ATPase/permease subunit
MRVVSLLSAVGRSWGLLSRRQQTALGLLAIARIIANGLDILGIAMIGIVVAVALDSTVSVPVLGDLGMNQQQLVTLTLLSAGLVFIIKTAGGLILSRTTLLYLAKIETQFSVEIARSIFLGSDSRLRKQSPSEIEWSILRSPHAAFSGFLGSFIALVAEGSLAVLVFAFLFYTDWVLAIAATVYFAIILTLFNFFSQSALLGAGRDLHEGSIAVNEAIKNLTSAFKEISVLTRTEFFLSPLAESRGKVARGDANRHYLGSIPRLLVELGLIAGAIGFVAFQYSRDGGLSSLVTFGVFLMGSLRMMSALLPLQRAFESIKFGTSSALAAQDLMRLALERQTEQRGHSETDSARSQSPLVLTSGDKLGIDIDRVSFFYDDIEPSRPVLKDLSLSIAPGSTVALVGPSGAGKSTLIDLILGMLEPSDGTIVCGGLSPKMLRSLHPGLISYVPQKPGLVAGSFEQNIALGVPPEQIDHKALAMAIERAQLTQLLESLPDGAKSSLGKHTDSLSGGQIQRLGLARALYTSPRLLVLDEATSALDAETESAISESLASLGPSTTIVIVAHRLSTVQTADVIHVLDDGKIVASGTFKELRKASPLVRRYVELMSFDD